MVAPTDKMVLRKLTEADKSVSYVAAAGRNPICSCWKKMLPWRAVKPVQSHHDNERAVPCDTSKNGRSLAALKVEQSRSGDSSQVDRGLSS